MSRLRLNELQSLDDNSILTFEDLKEIFKKSGFIKSVAEDLSGTDVKDGQSYLVSKWHDSYYQGAHKVVGDLSWPKSEHGVTGWSPTVPPVSQQAGATLAERTLAYLQGTGETDPAGSGGFVISENLKYAGMFGAVSRESTFFSHDIINHARGVSGILYLEPNTRYYVADTVYTGSRWSGIACLSEATRGRSDIDDPVSLLIWAGADENRKAVVLVGNNEVGAEPNTDSSGLYVRGFAVQCDGEFGTAGFGFYGTYITNDSVIERVRSSGASQHNMYFARGWYATFNNLIGLSGNGCGISLGMPLRYSDGTVEAWTTPAPYELNNCQISNIRAHSNGQEFINAPGTFDVNDPHKVRWGYGIGYGIGNGFKADTFTSEGNGGVGMYSYTGTQPIKAIRGGYIEANCKNSGLAVDTDMPNILIEDTSTTGGTYNISDVFSNYGSGGILHIGPGRTVILENVHQPRFLKSQDQTDPRSFIYLKNVYYQAGFQNSSPDTARPYTGSYENTRYTWQFTVNPVPTVGKFELWVYGTGVALEGSYTAEYIDGSTVSGTWPAGTGDVGWTRVRDLNPNLIELRRSGGAGSVNSYAYFAIVWQPGTYRV